MHRTPKLVQEFRQVPNESPAEAWAQFAAWVIAFKDRVNQQGNDEERAHHQENRHLQQFLQGFRPSDGSRPQSTAKVLCTGSQIAHQNIGRYEQTQEMPQLLSIKGLAGCCYPHTHSGSHCQGHDGTAKAGISMVQPDHVHDGCTKHA